VAVSQTLQLIESNPSVVNNTSQVRILWQSTQTGESFNLNKKTAYYWVSINGGAETPYEIYPYTLPKKTTATILDKTITVPHKDDGSGTISVRTEMATGISAGTVRLSKSLNLATIARASVPTIEKSQIDLEQIVLGQDQYLYTNRKSSTFVHEVFLKRNDGLWHKSIFQNVGDECNLNSVLFSKPVLENCTNSNIYNTELLLRTWSSATEPKYIVGDEIIPISVLIPFHLAEPSITMELSPSHSLGSAFNGLYIQNISKVQASITNSFQHGATLKECILNVGGQSYKSPYLSNLLTAPGNISVVGKVRDSREFVVSKSQTINVIPYSIPSLTNIVCERSDANGVYKDDGTYLHIKCKKVYSPITVNGTPKNTCSLRYSYYKGETLIAQNIEISSGADVDAKIPDVVSDTMSSYTIVLTVTDAIGGTQNYHMPIGTALGTLHLGKDGNKAAFGKYAEEDNLLDNAFDFRTRGDATFDKNLSAKNYSLITETITVEGDKDTYYPVHIWTTQHGNDQPVFLGLGKVLGSRSADWDRNHSNGTSSLSFGWLLRYNGWDGNGFYCRTLYACESYARLLSHIDGLVNAVPGVILYLRGGGATYDITCSVPAEISVHLETTNISSNSSYPTNVSPRTDLGNRGILYANTGAGDISIEDGVYNGWNYRKWYNGNFECWKTAQYSATFNAGSFNTIANIDSAFAFPISFVSKPHLSATSHTQTNWVHSLAQIKYNEQGITELNLQTTPPGVSTPITGELSVHIIGKWK
jgi:hypothetical protein